MADTKKCNVCKEEKELSEFYFRKDTQKYKGRCKRCSIDEKNIDRTTGIKTCKHCGEEKPLSEFQKAGRGRYLQPYCKPCDSKRKKKHQLQNIEEITERRKEYYVANKGVILERCRKWNQKTKAERAAKAKERRDARRLPIEELKRRKIETDRKYRIKNAEKLKKKKKEYYTTVGLQKKKESQRRLMNDVGFRIKKNLRGRIYVALKRGIKSEPTMKLLGCTIDEFKKHFESLFTDGMSWGKYMDGGIHIDHIIPCKYFDLTDPAQQKKCFHYTNMQPLWAIDNLKKATSLIHLQDAV